MSSRRVCISGASGLLGKQLAQTFSAGGWEVAPLCDPAGGRFRLGGPLAPNAFTDVEVFIHSAYDFKRAGREACFDTNVEGSIRLLGAARAARVPRQIFVSSLSSFPEAASIYGQSKYSVEQFARANEVAVIRPGLIVNPGGLGIFGKLARVARASPVVPLPGRGDQPQYLVGVRELADFTLARSGASAWDPTQLTMAAHRTPFTIREIVRRIGRARFPLTVCVPIPLVLLRWGFATFRRLGIELPFKEDSLVGLLNQDPDLGAAELWPDPCREFEDLCG